MKGESSKETTMPDGMRLYRVARPVPAWYGWDCKVGDTLPFPAQGNELGWHDVIGLSRCRTSRMWVHALIIEGILTDITTKMPSVGRGE